MYRLPLRLDLTCLKGESQSVPRRGSSTDRALLQPPPRIWRRADCKIRSQAIRLRRNITGVSHGRQGHRAEPEHCADSDVGPAGITKDDRRWCLCCPSKQCLSVGVAGATLVPASPLGVEALLAWAISTSVRPALSRRREGSRRDAHLG